MTLQALRELDRKRARELYPQLKSHQAVANALNIPATTISRWCQDLVERKPDDLKAIIAEARRQAAEDPNFTCKEFAKAHGLSARTIRNYVRGIERLNPDSYNATGVDRASVEERRKFVRQLYRDGKTYNQINKEYGIPKSFISIHCRDMATHNRFQKRQKIDDNLRDQARALYLDPERYSLQDIAKKLGAGSKRIASYCDDLINQRRAQGRVRIDPTKEKKPHPLQKLSDRQVIKLRRVSLRTGVRNWSRWATKFGVSVSIISMAARGVSFKHLDRIAPPIDKDTSTPPRPKTREWMKARPDEKLIADAILLYSKDPVTWNYEAVAKWMTEKSGREYRANHISLLFNNRDPSLADLTKPTIVKKAKPVKKVKSKLTVEELQIKLNEAKERRRIKREAEAESLRLLIEAEDRRDAELAALEAERKAA